MKKILIYTTVLIFFILTSLIIFLSVNGIETSRFNKIITKEIKKNQKDLEINFKEIKIKLDIKNKKLYFSTQNPKITYRDINLPIIDIKIYIDFLTLLRSNIEISRSIISFNKIEIENVKKLAVYAKPSNVKSIFLNNIRNGKIDGKFDLSYDKKAQILNYKVKGSTKNMDIYIKDKLKLDKTSFNFAADNELILINSINSKFQNIPIQNGSLKIKNNENFIVDGSINTKLETNNKKIKELNSLFLNFKFINKNKIDLKANLNHEFSINISKQFKINTYQYNLSGLVKSLKIDLNKNYETFFLKDQISKLTFSKSKIELNINNEKKNEFIAEGNYKINNTDFLKYKIKDNFNLTKHNLNLNTDVKSKIDIKLINYKKNGEDTLNVNSNIILDKKNIEIKRMELIEGKSIILLKEVHLDVNKKLKKFNSIQVKTFKNNINHNNFNIKFGEAIKIKGKNYDSTNLIEIINDKAKSNFLDNINKNININLENILAKNSLNLSNFNLIGRIEKGKFIKLSSKSEFSDDKFLDISLIQDKKSGDKTLEIFSDIPQAILADYNFFNGLEEGKLLLVSKIKKNKIISKLVIDNFKVKNAPGFAKLLALADLGGMVDLMSGEGMSFDKLEINLIDNLNTLKIEEIFAVGSSISILMDGYIENKINGITSLRGTMVPAKNLNKLISKIPVIGKILIPKEIGEGLFGVSFKMKGTKESLKTTVNPIKTLTPRFITKALERRKKTK